MIDMNTELTCRPMDELIKMRDALQEEINRRDDMRKTKLVLQACEVLNTLHREFPGVGLEAVDPEWGNFNAFQYLGWPLSPASFNY